MRNLFIKNVIKLFYKYFTSPISSKVNFLGHEDEPNPLLESGNVSMGVKVLYLELFKL